MRYRYGHDWNPFTREPIDEITEEKARKRWENGPAFSVSRLSDAAHVPDWTLIVRPGGDYVKVTRYDRLGSTAEVQHWSREEGGDGLFLSQLTTYVYSDDATDIQDLMEAVAHRTGGSGRTGVPGAARRSPPSPRPESASTEGSTSPRTGYRRPPTVSGTGGAPPSTRRWADGSESQRNDPIRASGREREASSRADTRSSMARLSLGNEAHVAQWGTVETCPSHTRTTSTTSLRCWPIPAPG